MTTPVYRKRRHRINQNPHPDAPLDHRCFPHLVDAILQHHESWLPLRATSKAFKKRIDALLFEKVVVRKAYIVENIESQLQTHNMRPTLVQSHYGRLPLFAPRHYLYHQSRKWANLKLQWAPLLKKYTKVLDVHIDVVRGGDAWALVACFPQVKTLRVIVRTNDHLPLLSWNRPDFMTNFDIDKVVLIPTPPSSIAGHFLSSIRSPVTTRKVVSNVLCEGAVGPYHGHMWFLEQSAVEQVVFIFQQPSVDQRAAFVASDKHHNHVSLRWCLFALQVDQILKDARGEQGNTPKITFVGFPQYNFARADTCHLFANVGLDKDLDPKRFFEELVAHDLSKVHAPPKHNKAYWRGHMAELVKHLSLKEYAETLEPGELENETRLNL